MTHPLLSSLLQACGHVLLTMPTGGGKTWLAGEQAHIIAAQGKKAIILVPTIALIDELHQSWQARFPSLTVTPYSSGHRKARPYRQSDLILMTPERLDLCTRQWRKHRWLADVGLIVADEIHLLASDRGAAYENALTRVMLLHPMCKILAMSGTLGNPERMAQWLGRTPPGVTHLHSDVRPTPLHWESHTTQRKEQTLWRVLQDEPTLIFVHSRTRAEELCRKAQERGIRAGFHHAGLGADERRVTEQLYRDGQLSALFCTPTLAVGVNVGADRVILYDLSIGKRTISVTKAWQRGGRAGRHGKAGHVSVIGNDKENPERFCVPDFEPVLSRLTGGEAEGFLLGCISGGFTRFEVQMQRMCERTYAGKELNWKETLGELTHAGAIQGDGQTQPFSLTHLGDVAARTMLSVRVLAKERECRGDMSSFDLIWMAASCLKPWYIETENEVLSTFSEMTPSTLLDRSVQVTDKEMRDALPGALAAFASCQNEEDAPEALGISRASLRAYREELARVLSGWAELEAKPKYRLVMVMLRCASPLRAATLTMLSGVGPAIARKWQASGIEDIEDLAQLSESDPRLGSRGVQFVQAAQGLVKIYGDLMDDPPPEKRSEFPLPIRGEIDPIRLWRASQLSVTREAEDSFTVTGGAEPHFVHLGRCDCLDFKAGRKCKHVLAVKIFQKDPDTLHHLKLME